MEYQQNFLLFLRAGMRGRAVERCPAMDTEQWMQLFRLASTHKVLPLVYEAAYRCPGFAAVPQETRARLKSEVVRSVAAQAARTANFLQLYSRLGQGGVQPVVVKGLVCRELYPQPDHRPSGDEDLLIVPRDFAACHAALLRSGLRVCDPQKDCAQSFEVPYLDPRTGVYLELHKALFEPGSDAVGDFNPLLEGAVERAVPRTLEGVTVRTLAPHDHMLYLLLHAFKHFIHSGFGIRQICDMVLWAENFGGEIDWPRLLEQCRSVRADRFAAAVFQIGVETLDFDLDKAGVPACWRAIRADARPMLEDVLSGGIYGSAQSSRVHSSTLTLNAVAAQKSGGKATVLQSLFPPRSSLQGRYPVLKKWPVMLPAVWAERILRYRREIRRAPGQTGLTDSVRIGSQRIALLQKYGILKE